MSLNLLMTRSKMQPFQKCANFLRCEDGITVMSERAKAMGPTHVGKM